MFDNAAPGLYFLSAGSAWEKAFEAALDFLARSESGVLLLGPAIGDAAKQWIQEQSLRDPALRLGARTLVWSEWVKGRARITALEQGLPFRVLNDVSRRELFRQVLRSLDEGGHFEHLSTLWPEDRFFSALIDLVEEARMAGLTTLPTVQKAQELLAEGADAVTREAYDDLWQLLLGFEARLNALGDTYDTPALAQAGTRQREDDRDLFLLGFDELSLVETDLLRTVAEARALFVPLALPLHDLQRLAQGQDPKLDHTAALFARGLVTGFSGSVQALGEEENFALPTRYLAEAHAPSEEARFNAALAKHAISEGKHVRFVLPSGALDDASVEAAFREELGLPRNFRARRTLLHPVARLFFHALALKSENYELEHGLEFAQLLHFTFGRFGDLPSRASRAGVRSGLADWKKKGEERGDEELVAFGKLLAQVHEILPVQANAVAYAEAVQKMAELCGIAELARRAPGRDSEREAHGALAAMVRNASMLAASVKEELTFAEWMREWGALLESTEAGEALSFQSIQFYRYGEWLPPASASTITFLMGFDKSIGPGKSFNFYFEEAARRKLSDLQLVSQVQADLTFLDQVQRMARGGLVLFSRALLDGRGKEKAPTWLSSSLPLEAIAAPEIARPIEAAPFEASELARTRPPEVNKFSASLLEVYKECPFRAFALKVLHLEDKVQASSLDVGHMEMGNITHRTLELYYGPENKGKDLIKAEEQEALLDKCLNQAVSETELHYFKGGADLLRVHLNRQRRILFEFIKKDAENYAKFPHFGQPLVEQKIESQLGPYKFTGKVDRVDIDPENKRILVVDYKSGATTPSSAEIKKLDRFQLQLYLDEMEKMLPGFESLGGLYVSLRSGARNQGIVRKEFNLSKKTPEPGKTYYFGFGATSGALKSEEDFAKLREDSRAEALRLADEIQKGDFDVRPLNEDSCGRCEVRPACRIAELQAPKREPWPRVLPNFASFLEAPPAKEAAAKKESRFNEEQQDALDRDGKLVFIEASAGTGKTTVIVERIRRFLAARLSLGEPGYRAVERFVAISFTDKSASELGHRVSESLMKDPEMGPRMAAQALQQISTIHGFCRRILSDFPVEAGISPLAELMDERESEVLKEEAFDAFFVTPPEAAAEPMDALFGLYPRKKIEGFLRRLESNHLLLADDLARYEAWMLGSSDAPEGLVHPEGVPKEALRHLIALSRAFHAHYEGWKRSRDRLDFNDLEALALKVLSNEHARAFYREKFSLILVDEFQDTNSVQRKIVEAVAQESWKNLFVVGDAKQSIYRFRAADVSIFQGLRREAETQGSLVTLFRNYRSREEVVAAANQVTASIFPAPGAEAPDFEAVAAESKAFRGAGGSLTAIEYGDSEVKLSAEGRREAEAQLLVGTIQAQLAKGRSPGSIAVLLRKISSNEAYLQALTRARIPFRVGSSKGFYGQMVVLDGIALLRALYVAESDMALLALLRSPWGRLSEDQILEIQRRQPPRTALWDCLREADAPLLFRWRREASFLSCSELLSEAYRHYPLDRREHLQTVKLLSILSRLEGEARPRVAIIDRLSHWAGWEQEESAQDDSTMPEPGTGGAVQVMTVHASKGLEFDVTILPDLTGAGQKDRSALRLVAGVGMALKMEEEENPAAYDEVGEKDSERDIAESKRLLYVAMTRAKEECILILPRPKIGGKEKKRESWADFVRGAGLLASPTAGEEILVSASEPSALSEEAVAERFVTPSTPNLRMETSISELAAYQFCGEFHRRKFVQGWDDRVVSLWPTDGKFPKKIKKELTPERKRAAALLKKLGIENKERGIALHRVLERAEHNDLASGSLWLKEAYVAQGVDPDAPELAELVDIDVQLLRRFLDSEVGQQLFGQGIKAFPEIPFQWNLSNSVVHGTMDRLIQKPDGTWMVVDYKSSILEESLERYRFQVASYMAAISAHARSQGESHPKVEGYLVDLFESKAYPVAVDPAAAEERLVSEIETVRGNYTLPEDQLRPSVRGIRASDHCFSCPYSMHCEIGRDFVLRFPK